MTKIKAPSHTTIAEHAINNILVGMQKLESDAPASAEQHFATAVVLLNQIANVKELADPELTEQLIYCRSLVLGSN